MIFPARMIRRIVVDGGICEREKSSNTRATCCCTMLGYLSLFRGLRVCNMLQASPSSRYVSAEIHTKYYAATCIRYCRTNLSFWQNEGSPFSLLPVLPFHPCDLRSLRELGWNDLRWQDSPRSENSKQACW